VLAEADPADQAEIYKELGVNLRYNPGGKVSEGGLFSWVDGTCRRGDSYRRPGSSDWIVPGSGVTPWLLDSSERDLDVAREQGEIESVWIGRVEWRQPKPFPPGAGRRVERVDYLDASLLIPGSVRRHWPRNPSPR